MQSAVLDVPLSSKEMCNIVENDTWNRLRFSRPVSHYPDLDSVTRPVLSLVYRLFLNDVKTKCSKGIMCICKDKITVYHILYNCQLTNSYFLQYDRLMDLFIYLYEIIC